MIRLFCQSRILSVAVLAASAIWLSACDNAPKEEPITKVEPAAKPEVAKPEPEPLPPGLSTAALDDIEIARSEGPLDGILALNRPEGAPAPIRVAVLLPLSGRAEGAGRVMLDAAQLALFDAGDERLMLLPYDTQSTEDGARAAAEAAAADGAELVLGPLFGAHVQAVAGIMQSRNIPVLAFSNDRTAAGNGAAILGLTPETEVRRIIDHARLQGLIQIAAFLPDSAFGLIVADRLTEVAPSYGVTVERVVHYPAGAEASDDVLLQAARNFASFDTRAAALNRERARLQARGDSVSRRALQRLENADTLGDPPYQAVLLSEGPGRLPTIAPLLAFYDVDPTRVQFLGLSNWYGAGLGTEATLIGAWFVGPDPTEFEDLMQRHSGTFGIYPGRLAAIAYDAVAIASDLAANAGPNGQLDMARVRNAAGFTNYYGPFRIGPDGITERLLSVIQVEANGLRVIDPAPDGFPALIN